MARVTIFFFHVTFYRSWMSSSGAVRYRVVVPVDWFSILGEVLLVPVLAVILYVALRMENPEPFVIAFFGGGLAIILYHIVAFLRAYIRQKSFAKALSVIDSRLVLPEELTIRGGTLVIRGYKRIGDGGAHRTRYTVEVHVPLPRGASKHMHRD